MNNKEVVGTVAFDKNEAFEKVSNQLNKEGVKFLTNALPHLNNLVKKVGKLAKKNGLSKTETMALYQDTIMFPVQLAWTNARTNLGGTFKDVSEEHIAKIFDAMVAAKVTKTENPELN